MRGAELVWRAFAKEAINMSVLVTGAAGNIGSNIVRTLLSEGEQVIGYDAAAPPPYSVVYPLLRNFPFVLGSVVDLLFA
jgi:nucleoside-diphosphate-sugar epimerase